MNNPSTNTTGIHIFILGACVIGDTNANSSTTEPNQVKEPVAEGNGDIVPTVNIQESQTPPEVSALGTDVAEEIVVKVDNVAKPPSEEPVDETKSKARAEFYQKITQASDDGSNDGKEK